MENPVNIHLHDPAEFDRRFEELVPESDTYRTAYLRVEKEHEATFGYRKYSNYESYRVTRSRRIKRRQNKET